MEITFMQAMCSGRIAPDSNWIRCVDPTVGLNVKVKRKLLHPPGIEARTSQFTNRTRESTLIGQLWGVIWMMFAKFHDREMF
jgi:hypothetical protein